MSDPYTSEEWHKLVTADADARVRKFAWDRFDWVQTLPFGLDPDDLVQEAEFLLWQGRRTWAGAKCSGSNVVPVLCATVRQLACRWGRKYDSQRKHAAMQIDAGPVELLPTPERNLAEIYVQKLREIVRDDSVLAQMIEYRLDHPSAREAEIAEALKLDVAKIYQANVRLGRKCKKLLEQIEHWKNDPGLV